MPAPSRAPVTLESLNAALDGAVNMLRDAQAARLEEERIREERLQGAKRRLAFYMQRPRIAPAAGLPAQPNLFKLFLAIDLAESQPVRLWSTFKYILSLVFMALAGFFSSLDMAKIIKTLTHNSPSTGSRMRLKKGLDKYAMAVRASVGAQTVCREARQDFCDYALSKGLGKIDLDAAVEELQLPMPLHMQEEEAAVGGGARGGSESKNPPDVRFGNDKAEARNAIEQLIVSTVVSRYVARMDELVSFLGTMVVVFMAVAATVIIVWLPPTLLLSQVGEGSSREPPCAFRIVGLGHDDSACIKPFTPIEDGTSLYKVHVYIAIMAIGAPIFWVCVAGIALQLMLAMTLEVLKGVDNERARVMFEQHPKSPASVALARLATGANAQAVEDFERQLRKERLRVAIGQLQRGSFTARANLNNPDAIAQRAADKEAKAGSGTVALARAAPSSFFSCFGGLFGTLTPAFQNEIESSRDGVLCMESEDFLATYSMMARDVADASAQVGMNVAAMMNLITQGLAGLAVFLVVVSAMTFASGQRFVVIALFIFAVLWVHILCGLTRDTRVYAFLVLAESTRYLNMVLWVDQCLDKSPHKSQEGKDLQSSTLEWPWAEDEAQKDAARAAHKASEHRATAGTEAV